MLDSLTSFPVRKLLTLLAVPCWSDGELHLLMLACARARVLKAAETLVCDNLKQQQMLASFQTLACWLNVCVRVCARVRA